MSYESALEKITWRDVLDELDPCKVFRDYAERELGLEEDSTITPEHIERARENFPEWADWFLMTASRYIPGSTPEERFYLANELKDGEYLTEVICEADFLTPDQRFNLANKIEDVVFLDEYEENLIGVITYAPDLTSEQRFALVDKLKDSEYLAEVICEANFLTTDQRFALANKFKDEYDREEFAEEIPDLTPEQREILRNPKQ